MTDEELLKHEPCWVPQVELNLRSLSPRVPDCRICCLDPGRDLLRLRAQATGQAFIKGLALEFQLEPLVSWILVGTIVRLCGLCSIDSILRTILVPTLVPISNPLNLVAGEGFALPTSPT